MKDVLFTHSYFLRFDPKQWKTGQPYPPLGTLYAVALMRQHGYDVNLFDTMFATTPNEIIPAIENYAPKFFVIYDDGFNYLTKMCLTNMRQAAFAMCKLAKAYSCTVIVSSSDSTDRYAEYLTEGADYVLIGEAEHTLLELVNSLTNNQTDLGNIAGLAYLKDNKAVKTQPRPILKELDSLPLPAWDVVDLEPYRQTWLKHAGYFSINMSTTRGCPFKCNWCAKPIYGNRYNSRSVTNVVSEIKLLQQNYRVEHIWFSDDIFGLKPGWVNEFADELQRQNISIRFKIQSRADLLFKDADAATLARAGCENAWIGAESGSQKILDAMDKGITTDQIYLATHALKKHGIKPSFFIQFGYPGETMADIGLTIKMINELLPHQIGISVSYPLPGTVFYQKVKAELTQKSNWTDSDEMALMFRNTYPAGFYKQLHKYVHQNYHKHLAKQSLRTLIARPFSGGYSHSKKAISFLYYAPLTFIQKFKLTQAQGIL